MAKNKNTGLGRGLDAIFLDNSADTDQSVTTLRLSEIEPNPDQPRRFFDSESLAQLADSIAANGLIQPIVVRPSRQSGYYEIVAGERRWRASKMAGLTEVPVIVMELDDKQMAELSLIENIQRESLNAIEEANAFKKLITQYALTQDDLSKRVGKSRSQIANSVRLLDLPDSVAQQVIRGELSAGHARALLGLNNPDAMEELAALAVSKGLSVRSLEQLVRLRNQSETERGQKEETEEEKPVSVDYMRELARKMTSRLGRRVAIHNKGKNRKIEIEFQGNRDLEQIIKRLCGDNIFDED